MHLLFLDESGKPGDRSFAVGGVAVRADEWPEGFLEHEDSHGAVVLDSREREADERLPTKLF